MKLSQKCCMCNYVIEWEDDPKDADSFITECPQENCGAGLEVTYLVLPGGTLMIDISPAPPE